MGFGVGLPELFLVFAPIAVVILVGVLIVDFGVRLSRSGRDPADRILRERLARGEITTTEFESARRILGR